MCIFRDNSFSARNNMILALGFLPLLDLSGRQQLLVRPGAGLSGWTAPAALAHQQQTPPGSRPSTHNPRRVPSAVTRWQHRLRAPAQRSHSACAVGVYRCRNKNRYNDVKLTELSLNGVTRINFVTKRNNSQIKYKWYSSNVSDRNSLDL